MSNKSDLISLETIHLLQGRLDRILYTVTGQLNENGSNHENIGAATNIWDQATIPERLGKLEESILGIVSDSNNIENLLNLYSNYPHLFSFNSPSNSSLQADVTATDLDISSTLSIIIASASLYSETASRLMAVTDLPLPSTDLSAQLISLQPQIAKLEVIQSHQQEEVLRLREKSAALMEQWYTMSILPIGEAWTILETRVKKIDQRIRRLTAVKKQADRLSLDASS